LPLTDGQIIAQDPSRLDGSSPPRMRVDALRSWNYCRGYTAFGSCCYFERVTERARPERLGAPLVANIYLISAKCFAVARGPAANVLPAARLARICSV
jgi:hypothetical protein